MTSATSSGLPILPSGIVDKIARSTSEIARLSHPGLADAYGQLGRAERASRELSEAERIQANGGSRLGTPPEDHPEDK